MGALGVDRILLIREILGGQAAGSMDLHTHNDPLETSADFQLQATYLETMPHPPQACVYRDLVSSGKPQVFICYGKILAVTRARREGPCEL